MTSKLKKLKDLNRKLTVNVETKKYDEKYQAKNYTAGPGNGRLATLVRGNKGQ